LLKTIKKLFTPTCPRAYIVSDEHAAAERERITAHAQTARDNVNTRADALIEAAKRKAKE